MTTDSSPPIQFAPTQGGRLAYQIFGDGPATVVSIPPLAQNIEIAWERVEIRRMLERFGSFCRYLHFDKRGTGASDRRSRVPGIDERVEDLRAVMDHAGVGSAHLYVNSEGGPMAILFAATYPDRAESLTLWGSGPAMVPQGLTEEQRNAQIERQEQFIARWGTPNSPVVDRFAPSLAGDQAFRRWHQRYERNSASTESLRDLLRLSLDMDVREILRHLDLPTLVFHRTHDKVVDISLGRELAAGIPGARMIELPGDDHFSYAGEIDPWMTEMERFVTGGVRSVSAPIAPQPSVRILTLGQFAVEIDGSPVPISAWGSRRARQLCKRLVAARGWPVTRDELFELLWPDEFDRARLGARLSVQLSTVRRILRGGVIADRETVRLNLDEVATDLEEFLDAKDDGAVIASYVGEFLPDDVYEDWTARTRDEARAKFVAATRSAAQHAQDRLAFAEVAEHARSLISLDRYAEDAHRMLVNALRASGDVGEARRAHERWSEAMAELGVRVESFEIV